MSEQWRNAASFDNQYWRIDDTHFQEPNGWITYGDEAINTPPADLVGHGVFWLELIPDRDISFDLLVSACDASFGADNTTVMAAIWQRANNAWTTVIAPTAAGTQATVHVDKLNAGADYFIMLASDQAGLAQYAYRWAGSIPPLPVVELVPPLRLHIGVFERTNQVTVDAPPIGTVVTFSGEPTLPKPFDGQLVVTSPLPGAQVMTSFPPFVIAVVSASLESLGFYVRLEYADTADFDQNGDTLWGNTDPVTGSCTLVPDEPVFSTTYWQVRISNDTQTLLNSPVFVFTVSDLASTSVSLPIRWNTTTTAERPIHMWHFDPPNPFDGDTVTIYGHGLPASGTLTYGDTVLQTTGWQLVPASAADQDDTTRMINGSTVTPEHYEVTFVTPVDDGPGAPLVLEA